jgi:hypothetical protein
MHRPPLTAPLRAAALAMALTAAPAAAAPLPPDPAALEAATDATLRGPAGCARYTMRWSQEGRVGLIPFSATGTAEAELRDGRWSPITLGEYTHGNSEVHIDLGAGALPFLPPMVGALTATRAADSLFGELVALASGDATTLDLQPRPGGGWIQTRGLRDGGRLRPSNLVVIEHDAALRPLTWTLTAPRPADLGLGRLSHAEVRLQLDAEGRPVSDVVELRGRLLLAIVLRRTLALQAAGPCAQP